MSPDIGHRADKQPRAPRARQKQRRGHYGRQDQGGGRGSGSSIGERRAEYRRIGAKETTGLVREPAQYTSFGDQDGRVAQSGTVDHRASSKSYCGGVDGHRPPQHSRRSKIGRQQPQGAIWALAHRSAIGTRREVKDAILLGRQQAPLGLDTRSLNPCGHGSGTSPARGANRIRKRLAS
ncbi:hypothetical protein CF326_g7497 [Tilletia indica]|nr:hypothetical protein CF326_g7497 [Tilletia indica]